MNCRVSAVAFLLAGMASAAQADLVSPSGQTTVSGGGIGGTHVGGTPPNPGFELGVVDGIFLQLGATVTGGATGSTTTTTAYSGGEIGLGGDFSTILFLGTIGDTSGTLTPTWTITQIQYSYGSGANTATYGAGEGFAAVTLAASAANLLATDATFRGSATTTGGFDFTQVDTLTLNWSFTFPASGSPNAYWVDVDAISNPEPGTIALFAFGALGLGGVAWRRRSRRLAAKRA